MASYLVNIFISSLDKLWMILHFCMKNWGGVIIYCVRGKYQGNLKGGKQQVKTKEINSVRINIKYGCRLKNVYLCARGKNLPENYKFQNEEY